MRCNDNINTKSLAICGIVGLPASYGGFETLVENLVKRFSLDADFETVVYCSGKFTNDVYLDRVRRVFLPIKPNGASSVIYDFFAILHAVLKKSDVILILGVSGAIFLPLFKLLSNAKFIINIDGLEWKRQKWGRLASSFLKLSEYVAVKFSDEVIADNRAVQDYVCSCYGVKCNMIAYGGDNAIFADSVEPDFSLPDVFGLGLCRIEPENNVDLILNTFSKNKEANIVFIGNWRASEYGRGLFNEYQAYDNIFLLDAIYDACILKYIRENASFYVHGHSAGGTNPSLVEMMYFEVPIFAFDCSYNRFTTNNLGAYFKDAFELSSLLKKVCKFNGMGAALRNVAVSEYSWNKVTSQYLSLISDNMDNRS